MSTDQFNFVGLTRSPVKRTPQTGYYDGEGHRTYTKGEPVSAATTERMSIGSVNSTGSTDPRRRRALRPVPANAIETSHTPSSVALLLSSISSKRAALSVRRSTLPVPRTLHLSPAEATRPDPTMMSERTDCASRCSGSSSSQQHYLRDDAERHHSPPSSTRAPLFPETSSPITPSPQQQKQLQNQQQHQEQQQQRHQHHQHQLQHQQQQQHQHQQSWSSKPSHDGSPSGTRTPTSTPSPYTSGHGPNHGYTGGSSSADRHHQPATPAVADPYPTPSRASHAGRSYDAHDDDGGGEWSSDCSFTNGAVFSPDPTSLSVVPVHRSGGVSGVSGGVGGGGGSSSSGWRSSRRGDNEERSVMVSPISNIYSASKVRVGGSALRGVGEATPRCPETRGASPFPEATVNRFGESSTRTPASGSGSAFLRVGGTRSPVVPESVAAGSSSASRYAARGGATPATAGARSSSNASRYAVRDRATPAAEERREDELLPDTPAAAATLAGMMMGGAGDVADSLCETVDEERSFQEKEEEEEEEGGFLAEGPSEGSADAQIDARSTTPESPLNASTVSLSRSAMTPRRPRSAMALLDISAETPRRMIRGILGGSSLAGMSWKQQRPQQEPRFVPKVSKVTETEIVEDDTPRRFILGMLANSGKKVDGVRGLSEGRTTCPPNGALVGASVRYNSSSAAGTAAAVAATTTAPTAAAARAAAATAAVSSSVASPSSSSAAAAAVAVLPRAGERSERAVQDDVTDVRSTGGTAVLQTIATSSAAVPVDTAPRAAALPRDVTVVGPGSVSGGGKGRQILKAGVGLAAIVGFCVIVLGVFVLACLVLSKPALAVPIY